MNALQLGQEGQINHYPRHIGDWMTATAHLSEVEECIYSRLLDRYYAKEEPLPLDLPTLCRLVRAMSAVAKRAVETVVSEFFTKTPEGYRQDRCDEEIAKFHDGDAERELREENERERVRLHREERAALFKILKAAGKHPHWNTSISELRKLANGNAPETRTGPLQAPTCNALATAYQNQEPEPEPEPNLEEVKGNVGLTPDDAEKQLAGKALRDSAKRVLECLNRNAGRKYEPVDANLVPILARMREGYTERDLCAIAAVKARQWKSDERMEQYIRPKTLYNATNAAQYRAELPSNRLEAAE